MQTPSFIPHSSWLDLLPWLLGALVGASTRWIPFWQNRKKPNADVHETDARTERTYAEARKINAEASKSIGEIVVAMSEQLSDAQRDITSQREFLQSQLERKTEQEEVARVRTHRAIAEIQRCVMRIRDYEEVMKAASITFEAFEFKTYEDIMRENGK